MKKESFIIYYNANIKREGSDKLLEYITNSDFFIASASTRYHSAYEGGLCEHSVNVYERLVHKVDDIDKQETIAICALLHDLCKINFYKIDFKNQKNANGQWEKVPYYTVDDILPFGHGEKSVFMIERFMKLTVEEAMAINWHMGGFDDRVKGGSYALNGAFEKYPLALHLHISDLEASYFDEPIE